MNRVVIFGATSAIAQATAKIWAAQGCRLVLVGRNTSRLERIAQDLIVRGAENVSVMVADLDEVEEHEHLLDQTIDSLGRIDLALIAQGVLGDQTRSESDFEIALQEIRTNAISVLSLLTHLANRLEGQRSGTIIAISSVAGDRGRRSNYVYGSAKAATTTFMQGLRQRLSASGVQVLTVKPGFVDSPMTESFEKNFLWASPDQIADRINRAVQKRNDVIYAPWFWRYIMLVVRAIPESLFRRLSL